MKIFFPIWYFSLAFICDFLFTYEKNAVSLTLLSFYDFNVMFIYLFIFGNLSQSLLAARLHRLRPGLRSCWKQQDLKGLWTHKRYGLNLWVRNISWRRAWTPTPVFLPGKSHGQRRLLGYSPHGHKRVGRDWSDLACTSLVFPVRCALLQFNCHSLHTEDCIKHPPCFLLWYLHFKFYTLDHLEFI